MRVVFAFEFPIHELFVSIPVDGHTSVYQLKEFIYRQVDIAIPLQQIYFKGHLLYDYDNLYETITSFPGAHDTFSLSIAASCRFREDLSGTHIEGAARNVSLPAADIPHVVSYRQSLFFNALRAHDEDHWRCDRSVRDGNFTIVHPTNQRQTLIWLIAWTVSVSDEKVHYYIFQYTADVGDRFVPVISDGDRRSSRGEGEAEESGDEEEQEGREDVIPGYLTCPITQSIFRDPVICTDGHTYERAAIMHWWETSTASRSTSPLTNQPLASCSLIPNIALRQAADEWTAARRPRQRQRQQVAEEERNVIHSPISRGV